MYRDKNTRILSKLVFTCCLLSVTFLFIFCLRLPVNKLLNCYDNKSSFLVTVQVDAVTICKMMDAFRQPLKDTGTKYRQFFGRKLVRRNFSDNTTISATIFSTTSPFVRQFFRRKAHLCDNFFNDKPIVRQPFVRQIFPTTSPIVRHPVVRQPTVRQRTGSYAANDGLVFSRVNIQR